MTQILPCLLTAPVIMADLYAARPQGTAEFAPMQEWAEIQTRVSLFCLHFKLPVNNTIDKVKAINQNHSDNISLYVMLKLFWNFPYVEVKLVPFF